MAKDQKPKKDQAQSADDILSSLMEDLKDVDKVASDDSFENDLGLDPELLKSVSFRKNNDENIIQLDEASASLDADALNPNGDDSVQPEGLVSDSDSIKLSEDENAHPLDQFNFSPAVSLTEPSAPANPNADEKTTATELQNESPQLLKNFANIDNGDGEKTLAVAGFSQRTTEDYGDKVKVSVGQMRGNAFSSGYAAWGSADSSLAHAENLRYAQEKILDLERENEKLRLQNEELIAASEIVKERADLLTSQLHEFKADRDSLDQSFKNEASILKSQVMRKDAEIIKAQMKIDELESRMKFDLKKIRVRERELENRLELIRAEKNALVKTKDEQILDVRRKLDQVQLEVESYRQKCVELNKVIDTNQESFKRTTRALRLAMANLELQEENKPALKKVD